MTISADDVGAYGVRADVDVDGSCPVPMEPADDHGDGTATATTVRVPSTTVGELEQGGDRDYFRLVVDEATNLKVGTTGSTDTYGTLFDSQETLLETDDDDGAALNFDIESEVAAGTYYLEVRGAFPSTTGAYELHLSTSVNSPGGGASGAQAFHLLTCSDIPVGITLDHDTQEAALDAARRACVDDGGRTANCRAFSGAFEQCGVITYADHPERCAVNAWRVDSTTVDLAEAAALDGCRDENPGYTCEVATNDAGVRMSGCNASTAGNAVATDDAAAVPVQSLRMRAGG